MTTGLIYDDRFLDHATGEQSPEQPDRLVAMVEKLKAAGLWERLEHLPFAPASMEQLLTIHEPAYLERLERACRDSLPYIDVPDSAICPVSFDIARLAAGGVIAAARAVVTRQVDNAFCAVRPPGHHAERDQSMGFCLLNNVALAAEHLIREHGLERVAIVDFDVHHGNGTQHLFEHRSDVLFISLHEDPASQYPGTGFHWETGAGRGLGHTLNVTFEPGQGDEALRHQVKEHVLPALSRFQPQMMILSAGFDASEHDPLGNLAWTAEGFFWLTRELKAAAEDMAQGRLLSVLEGGYNYQALAEATALHIGTLMEPRGVDRLMAIQAGL
jgi:acetoin utilization deacetylase AcuC-like enzyme